MFAIVEVYDKVGVPCRYGGFYSGGGVVRLHERDGHAGHCGI